MNIFVFNLKQQSMNEILSKATCNINIHTEFKNNIDVFSKKYINYENLINQLDILNYIKFHNIKVILCNTMYNIKINDEIKKNCCIIDLSKLTISKCIDNLNCLLDNNKKEKEITDKQIVNNPTTSIENDKTGFIILRHVNNELTNKYWIHCYECIRNFYPENKILIIDDDSNYEFITNIYLYKTTIINSEYKKRGELLPYYYYLHNKLFEVAVIIHDSVFVNKKIDLSVDKYKLLWHFELGGGVDDIEDQSLMINKFNNKELYKFYTNKSLWKGCFGGMTIITHKYLKFVDDKYDISKLLDCVLTRHNRCSFERVIACLLQKNYKPTKLSLLNNIHRYCRWGVCFENKQKLKYLTLIKVWTGR